MKLHPNSQFQKSMPAGCSNLIHVCAGKLQKQPKVLRLGLDSTAQCGGVAGRYTSLLLPRRASRIGLLTLHAVYCCFCVQVSAVTGAISLGFMKMDLDSTGDKAAAAAEERSGAPDDEAAGEDSSSSAQARSGGFKSRLLQACFSAGVELGV